MKFNENGSIINQKIHKKIKLKEVDEINYLISKRQKENKSNERIKKIKA